MSIPAPETKIVNAWRIACDGGDGALGHPRVWYTVPKAPEGVECMYCDAQYVHEDFAPNAD